MKIRHFLGGLVLALMTAVASAAALVVLPQQLAVDVNGAPRSGAKLYVYDAGGTTPRTAYTTSALDPGSVHTQPVTSVSTGLFPAVYIDPAGGNYKLVLKDSADVTIWTEDNIPPGTVSRAQLGQTFYPLEAGGPEDTANVTPTLYYYPVGNPRRYGAVGDCVTDDDDAVQTAMAVIKATYVHANLESASWDLNPGDCYLVSTSLHFGGTTASDGRIKHFNGNGAKFVCNLTTICADFTGVDRGTYNDLWVENGAATPKILVLLCRHGHSSTVIGYNEFTNLRVLGEASIAGVFIFSSEINTFIHPHIGMDANTPFGLIISDTGRYWNGAAWVDAAPYMPNMLAGDAVVPGDSASENHFFGSSIVNKSAYADGGRAAMQLIGAARCTWHGGFWNINDNAMRVAQTVADNGNGGNTVYGIKVFGFNPHNANDVSWENVSGNITGLELFGNHSVGATTADLLMTAGTLIDSNVQLGKVVLNSQASGSNIFRIGTDITVGAAAEGDVYLSDGATVTYSGGTTATKRFRIHDADSARVYSARDVRNFTPVSSSGTGEDNLDTYDIVGSTGFLGQANQKVTVRAAGTKTNSNGNKTIKFYLGATSFTVLPAANDVLSWVVEVDIYTTAAAAQELFIKAYQNSTLVYAKHDTATIDLSTGTTTMKLTGECANASDVITQTAWVVETN